MAPMFARGIDMPQHRAIGVAQTRCRENYKQTFAVLACEFVMRPQEACSGT